MRVLIVGASAKPERYAHMAMKRLQAAGHDALLFNPALAEIEGIPVYNELKDIPGPIDTVTLYVGPERLSPMVDAIIALRPGRIISNPGTECVEMRNKAEAAGIEYLEACTLVLLSTGRF